MNDGDVLAEPHRGGDVAGNVPMVRNNGEGDHGGDETYTRRVSRQMASRYGSETRSS